MSAGDPARAASSEPGFVLTLPTGLDSKAILWEGPDYVWGARQASEGNKRESERKEQSRTRVGGKKFKKERDSKGAKGTRQAEGDVA